MKKTIAAGLALVLGVLCCVSCGERQTKLFNGKNLEGWKADRSRGTLIINDSSYETYQVNNKQASGTGILVSGSFL